ncbi:hypothetical protein [Achromobacter spanius]|uniref:hypothetical protein n=1 Tax=Achromobacter spanius TaxID=217203 RepID=UPI0012ED0353|nr:hypothetical protein [Achromobacter spanius]
MKREYTARTGASIAGMAQGGDADAAGWRPPWHGGKGDGGLATTAFIPYMWDLILHFEIFQALI